MSDSERDPAWLDRVPTARLVSRGGWDTALPDPNTAYVSISTFRRERDRSARSGWRYSREPRAVLLDDLAQLMPAGEIVPVTVGTKGHVVLADHAAVDVIDSCTYPGASQWNPGESVDRATRETVQRYSRDCHHDAAPAALGPSRHLGVPEQAGGRPPAPAVRIGRPCECCGGKLLAPVSVARGYCERCRIDRADRYLPASAVTA